MKRCYVLLTLLLALTGAAAATVNVERYGAKPNGRTLNTKAIQAAIDAAAREGGTVVFPAGVYLTGSIFVKSGVTLRIDRGVTLLGSQDIRDYPVMPTRIAGIETAWPAALVNVYRQRGAAIEGEGTIDGDGKVFWDSYWTLRRAYEPRGLRWASDYDAQRPRLIQVFDAADVRVGGGLLLRRSGFWTLHICYSTGVTVDGVVIRNNSDGLGPSTDGIDIDSSNKVLVQHADIDVNDDALCLKAGRDADGLRVARPTEDVIIRDAVVRAAAAGITFGSETSGGFRNIEAYNITVEGRTPVGILFKSAHTRGGFGENLRIHDITMKDVPVVLRITMNWNPSYSYAQIPADVKEVPPVWRVLATRVPPEQGRARFHDVTLANIRATGATRAFEVDGYREAPLRLFRLSNLDIQAKEGGWLYDIEDWRFDDARLALGMRIETEDGAQLRGVAPAALVVRPRPPKEDPSKKSYEEQDKS